MLRAIAFAGAAALLAAAPAAAQPSGWRYTCPEPGTVVERTEGGTINFRGADASDPFVCLAGGGQRLVLGIWAPSERQYVSGRAHLAALLAGPAGGERRFDYFSTGRDSTSIHVYETWRLAGFEPVRVPAGTFDAVRLQRSFQISGIAYSYVQTVWLDRATNAPVKVKVEHVNAVMAPTLFDWEATELRQPAGRRAGT